ncbi:PSME3-interacting protein-like [Dreissena polymorpha]|uniref:FAM192A/Fyv6 N-terminal domain-containing protein n=1 Tax=Dreissena polymorpha TaxID=45954 RepID=A0A9D4IG21_DREPO|nr:PSME3-interacting protein-like [Dreissena polymorpha]XP_052231888.1 PSME3-interacting protein-like [Dreissena polymorpha]XP_052231889.1 PSME3-interacting protein-like [Dreissena polymorpha]KAH3772069.1 hypothetical protein DPMN_173402 [Dreissena polymorpha]
MSFSASSVTGAGISLKNFESQSEVDEKKRKRQEEWEKVRKPEDPEEAPEQPVDNRCLYDKLEEQRLKKQEEFEEKVAFRNQVRRLDEDEVDFLDFCSERQHEINDERKQEERQIITEMKDSRVLKIEEKASLSKTDDKKQKVASNQGSKKSQMALLAGAVKRKSVDDKDSTKKLKTEADDKEDKQSETAAVQSTQPLSQHAAVQNGEHASNRRSPSDCVARVVAVLPAALPGITDYDDSSDSLSSSSDSDVDFTLFPRTAALAGVRQQVQYE